MMHFRTSSQSYWVFVAMGLCGATLALLAVLVALPRHGSIHDPGSIVSFNRPGAGESLLALAVFATAALGVVAFWRQLAGDRARRQIWVAGGLCLLAYPASLVIGLSRSPLFGACEWSAEYSVAGPDGKTYYVLHAPPPLNGSGHCALARRKSGSPLHFTVEILTDFEWTRECFHGEEVLRAGMRDPDAAVRKAATALVKSGAPLHRLSPGT